MRRRGFLRTAAGSPVVGSAIAHPRTQPTETGTGEPGTETPTTDGNLGDDGSNDDGPGFEPLAVLPVDGAREAVVGADGSTVFLAVEDGFAVVDVAQPADPRLVAERRGLLSDSDGGALRDVQDVAVDGDRLLVMGPAHSGTDGPRAAILYDVGDPADPRRLAVHRTDYPIHNGTLEGGRAYLAANDGGTNPLAIVEMEATGGGADGGPAVLGTWSPVDADTAWADVPTALRPIHDVIVHGEVAYASYWDAGTWLVDVSDPEEPRAIHHVGERSPRELADVDDVDREGTELPGNHHSAAIDGAGTLLAVGHEAWDADDDGEGAPGGIDLVDVPDRGSPRVRSTIEPPPTEDPSFDGVWTTAHNFELRGDRLYSAWYRGGVRVHDLSDPGAPRQVAAWRDSETTRFWTAQFAAGADAGDGTGAVVASSMGTDGDDGAAGLYTFPAPARGSTPTRRVTATPGMAGFGVAAALVGAGLASLLARRRGRG